MQTVGPWKREWRAVTTTVSLRVNRVVIKVF